jgi:hypothetical protein
MENDGLKDFEEALLKSLLRWFKKDFFHWVNAPECQSCKVSELPFHVSLNQEIDF